MVIVIISDKHNKLFILTFILVYSGASHTTPPNSGQPLNNGQPSWHGLNLAYV